jgi:hypothetical protein
VLDDANFEPIPADLMNELHGSGVRLHAEIYLLPFLTYTSPRIARAKCVPFLFRTLPKVFVKHLLPTDRVESGSVRYYTIEIKKNGVVLVTIDALALGPRHESLSCYSAPERRTGLAAIWSRRGPFQILTAGILR